ncbi:MAG: hypothetical protein JNL01_08255 [Bdellovibrionales bacterium]|nr:hypothetical protein [Bdellovibrionales bacterium]
MKNSYLYRRNITRAWPALIITPAVFAAAMTLALNARAADSKLVEKCKTLPACVEFVSSLTHDQYVLAPGVAFETAATQNTEINAQNADLLFSMLLDLNGLARVPAGQPKLFKLVKQRDARDAAVPQYEASYDQDAIIPNTHDLATLNYAPKFPNFERLEEMARSLRSFLPANARIVPDAASMKVRMTAAIPDLKRCLKMMREMDRKPTAAEENDWKEQKKRRAEKSAKCPDPLPCPACIAPSKSS